MSKFNKKSCSEMDSRKNLMNIINDGIREWGDNRIYYECRNDHDFTGIYKILALPDDLYNKGAKRTWEDLGPAIFRIALALGYDFGSFYDHNRKEWEPVLKAEHIKDVYVIADCVRHIKGVMKKSKARSHAREIGLTYWPALIDWKGDFDSMALVYAEDYLSRKHGLWGTKDANGVKNTGGWDSYGHHGISMNDVKLYWFAAGCKNTPKFHAQLRTHTLAKKGESADEFMNYARGRKWLDARTIYLGSIRFSRKAVIALGRIPSYLRGYAVEGLRADNKVVRIRHLNWEHAASVQRAIAAHKLPELARAVACLSFGINGDTELGVYGEKECVSRLDAISLSIGHDFYFNVSAISEMIAKKKYIELMHRLYIANLQDVVSIPISRGLVTYSVESRDTPFTSEWEKVSLGDVSNDIARMLSVIFTWRNHAALMKLLTLEADDLSGIMVASKLIAGAHDYANFAIPLVVVEEALKHPLLGFSCMEVIESEHGVRECVENKESDLYKQVKSFVDVGHIRKAAALPGIPPIYGLSLSLGNKVDLFSMSHPCSYKTFNLKAINAIIAKDRNVFASDLLNLSNALGMEAVKCLDIVSEHASADFGFDYDDENRPIPVDHSPFHIFANNVRMPSVHNALGQQWNQFFSKNKDCLMYAGHVHSEMAVPKSKEAFVAEMAKHRYKNGPRASDALLELAGRVNMSQDTFDLYLEAVTEIVPKTYEMLPFIRIDGSKYEDIGHEYILEKLDYNDPTMLSVGLETACCQHLEGVGSRSAEHSYTHPSSAVYVLRKNGSIVAESWVWRNDNDGVVFDSIEGRSSVPDKVVAAAFMELAKQLIGKLCIRKVYVGATTYGFTGEFVSINDINSYRVQTTMIEPCSYMDGRYHYLVVSADKAGEE